MTPSLLVDAIVRQTMVLVAALATSAGQRTPLAHVAEQVFVDLVRELKDQGLSNRLIADMFGVALRTYHTRVARLSESKTERGRSLWANVLTYIRTAGPVSRAEILGRFERDDDGVVRAVLRDLVESDWVRQAGRGDSAELRITEAGEGRVGASSGAADPLVLVAVHERGPATVAEIQEAVPIDEEEMLMDALERLEKAGLVRRVADDTGLRFTSDSCVIPLGAEAGWEAAVLDHYQALVTAIVAKLSRGLRVSALGDQIGGSTFTYDLWKGHPMEDEVRGRLRALRESGSALRQRVLAYNSNHEKPADTVDVRVISYSGQMVREEEESDA